MRVLYIDIDSLRPDHLGCYGYHRNTSPNIDRLAEQGVRFDNCHCSDAPCLPSRTALYSGRFGYHTGVVNHGGAQSQPSIEGPGRDFQDSFGLSSWAARMRGNGYRTAMFSPFANRHSAWHWFSGWNETYDLSGRNGNEVASEVSPVVIDWIERNGGQDNWFMHVNFWDPHTPYRTPEEFGNPFADDPLPSWYNEEIRLEHWKGVGPHSAQELMGFHTDVPFWWEERFNKKQPWQARDMEQARRVFDGYDCGVRYADEHVGRVLNALADQGVLDETMVIVSADHGENLGELNIYSDHQTADQITTHIPCIMNVPGVTEDQAGRVDKGLLYHFDFAATTLELTGGRVPKLWDGRSFAHDLKEGRDQGRDYLVVSQGAWSCQRGVRWGDHFLMHSYHNGYHGFPDDMLFNVADDPHEQNDLATERPDLVNQGKAHLVDWQTEMMRTATDPVDPLQQVIIEGGPFHTRQELPAYLRRLRETDRADHADILAAQHPNEVNGLQGYWQRPRRGAPTRSPAT